MSTNLSPLLEVAANYWTGSASAQDSWNLQSQIATGTNGTSALSFNHLGSIGNNYVAFPVTGIQFPNTPFAVDFGSNAAWTLNFTNASGVTTNGALTFASSTLTLKTSVANNFLAFNGNVTSSATACVSLGNTTSFAATAAITQVDIQLAHDTFNPGSGSASFQAVQISPAIKGTSNGNTTALVVNPTLTATNLTGTNRIASFQSAGTTALDIGYVGTITTYGGLTTVRRGVPSSIASTDLTAQTAAIAATTLLSAPATGAYRVAWSATITTASDTSSVLGGSGGFQVIYTSPTDSVVKTTVSGNSVTSAANTTGTAVGDDIVIYAKTGTNIQFQYGYTSVQTTTAMVFELHVSLEAL